MKLWRNKNIRESRNIRRNTSRYHSVPPKTPLGLSYGRTLSAVVEARTLYGVWHDCFIYVFITFDYYLVVRCRKWRVPII